MSIFNRIGDLLAANPSLSQAKLKAYLLIEDYPQKDIDAAVKQVMGTNSPLSWQQAYHDWLAAESRTEKEAYDYLMTQSRNVRNQISQYLNHWALAESVRQGTRVRRTITGKAVPKGEPEPEVKQEEEEVNPVKQAWADLHAELRRQRPRKTKVHPDKVSHLGDEELTAAYTEAFQNLNKGPRASRKAA